LPSYTTWSLAQLGCTILVHDVVVGPARLHHTGVFLRAPFTTEESPVLHKKRLNVQWHIYYSGKKMTPIVASDAQKVSILGMDSSI
jgi:hypothetical protein